MYMNELKNHKIVVVGGGAAGMMAAGTAAQFGGQVILIEKNDRLGKKLSITGKGRCNVTNACDVETFLKNVPRNGKFLIRAAHAFPPVAVMDFFNRYGCTLKVERGNRVFPESDRSASVIGALRRFLDDSNVEIRRDTVRELLVSGDRIEGVRTDTGIILCENVILSTGGASYPLTGSTGDGYKLAGSIGHCIISPRGSLVPLEEKGDWCSRMQGLSLKNIGVKLLDQKNRLVYEDFGELMFTHFGLSGPVVLSCSAHLEHNKTYRLCIDLKPALDEKKLDQRVLRDMEQFSNKTMEHALEALLPRSMIPVILCRAEIQTSLKAHSLTKVQRKKLLELTKCFSVDIMGTRPLEEAIITAGGIKTQEIDPKTMESKLISGLYFAGEIIDTDAYTGGFNLQIAWSTGYAAGIAAGKRITSKEE